MKNGVFKSSGQKYDYRCKDCGHIFQSSKQPSILKTRTIFQSIHDFFLRKSQMKKIELIRDEDGKTHHCIPINPKKEKASSIKCPKCGGRNVIFLLIEHD